MTSNHSRLQPRHEKEWVKGSGVSSEITRRAVTSVSKNSEIAEFLGWKAYKGTPGYFIWGYDLELKKNVIQQFKPNKKVVFPDGKEAKYLTSKRPDGVSSYDAILLPGQEWDEISLDPEQDVFLLEGGKKAGLMLALGYVAIAICGVEMWHKKGSTKLVGNLDAFQWKGRRVFLTFDSDWIKNPGVLTALKKAAVKFEKLGATVFIVAWDDELGKGIDDVYISHGEEKVQEIVKEALRFDDFMLEIDGFQTADQAEGKDDKPPMPSEVSQELAEIYRDKLAWQSSFQCWMRYGAVSDGLWVKESPESVKGIIHAHLRTNGGGKFASTYSNSIYDILKSDLEVKTWDEVEGYIPMQDGVLDIQTMELYDHNPGRKLTWQLPYKWADSEKGCEIIEDFLVKVSGSEAIAEVLLAYLNAVVTKRHDLQRYLELIGGGGTGKSTFMNLAMALAGERNTVSSRLALLQQDRFELARFRGKILGLFPDSERWQGGMSILKKLTGGDLIPFIQKNIQQSEDFVYKGMLMLSANEPIESSDRTSGAERRALTIEFNRRVKEFKGRDLTEEFKPFLAGLLRRVLQISRTRVTQLIKYTNDYVPELGDYKAQHMIEINPMAAWVERNLVLDMKVKTYIGRLGDPEMVNRWLYPNYVQYMQEEGHKGTVASQRFKSQMLDLFKNQLNCPIVAGRDRHGSFLQGIGFRHLLDPDGKKYKCPVTQIDLNTDPNDALVTQLVTAQTRVGDGCDGDDGLSEIVDNFNRFVLNLEITSPNTSILNFPSSPSQPSPTGVSGITTSITTPVTASTTEQSPLALPEASNPVMTGGTELNTENKIENKVDSVQSEPIPRESVPSGTGFTESVLPPVEKVKPVREVAPDGVVLRLHDVSVGDRVRVLTGNYINKPGCVLKISGTYYWIQPDHLKQSAEQGYHRSEFELITPDPFVLPEPVEPSESTNQPTNKPGVPNIVISSNGLSYEEWLATRDERRAELEAELAKEAEEREAGQRKSQEEDSDTLDGK